MTSFDAFDMNARRDTFVPLIHCVINDTLSQVRLTDLCQTLLQFMDVIKLMRVANVSMHKQKSRIHVADPVDKTDYEPGETGWPPVMGSHGESWNLVRPFSRPGKLTVMIKQMIYYALNRQQGRTTGNDFQVSTSSRFSVADLADCLTVRNCRRYSVQIFA